MPIIPCFLCGKELGKRTDKNEKPYFVCDPCGMQIFIRRKQGIDNLQHLMATLRTHELPMRVHAETLFNIKAILQELDGIEHEIKKLDGSIGFFSEDKLKKRARTSLQTRQKALLIELEHVTKTGAE